MKRIATIIIALAAIAVSGMAQQEAAERLFDQFINDSTYSGCVKSVKSYVAHQNGTPQYRNVSYTFALPTAWGDKVEALAKGLGDMQPEAYNMFMRLAGSSDQAQTTIAVERGNDIRFGVYPNHNYLALYFRSATDSLRRHVYAMAWYDDTKDGCIKGSLYKVYGLDPAKKAETPVSRKIYVNGVEVNLNDHEALRRLGLDINESGKIVSGRNGSQNVTNVTVVKSPQAIQREKQRTEAIMEATDLTTSIDGVEMSSSTEFIQEFKRLHDLFINLQGDYMTTQQFQTRILARMDNMVQSKGSLLTMKEERQLCIKMLKSMKQNAHSADDGVMESHVELIIKRLKKMK